MPHWFGQPNTNELAAWSATVGILLAVIAVIFYLINYRKEKREIPLWWGVKASGRVIWKSFLLGIAVVTAAYIILFFVEFVFNTDFRIWVIAMRQFSLKHILYAIAYVPAFMIFYLSNSMLVNGNGIEKRPEWLTILLSCLSNIAGIVILVMIQYGGFIANGMLRFNAMRILNIFPLIVLIPIGTVISRRYYKETGSIYAGSFVIAILYTMMTVANTASLGTVLFYWNT